VCELAGGGEAKVIQNREVYILKKKTKRKNMLVWFDFQGIQIIPDDVGISFVPEVMISNKQVAAV
jgi:hypothetical protein